MKREWIALSASFILLILNLIIVNAEYACSQDSDCLIDLSTSNSCLNSSTMHNLSHYSGPYYCRCEYNFCTGYENSSRGGTIPKDCSLIVGRENCWKGILGQVCYWDDETKSCSSKKAKCKDLDGGLDYANANITYGFEDNDKDVSRDAHGDYCGMAGEETGKLKEYYCANDYQLGHTLIECPNGCYRGACINYSGEINVECKNLYWINATSRECGQKKFCGTYIYWSLQTFETKEECLKAVGINCPSNSVNEDGKCMFNLSNGRKAEIKIMPETASQNAIQRLGELNFTVELKEVGKGDNAKPVYELTGNKQGKFLGIFKIMVRVQAQVDAETGEVKKIIKPWWSFLTSGI